MSSTFLISALVVIAVLGILLYFIFKPRALPPLPEFKQEWRNILLENVAFYQALEPAERQRFEGRMQLLLQRVKITGIETEVNEVDRVFVAASGVIPTFGFPQWNQYPKLNEVLLYKTHFRQGDFATEGADRRVAGMVGGGFMNGKLLLSKPSLRQGFLQAGRGNTGIHEFVHLLDKADGDTNGIPAYFMKNAYVVPWLEMVRSEMEAIERGESDIDDYATTNKAEFFAVIAEYFFNRPEAFADNHPRLFALLEQVFQQDMDGDGIPRRR
ncbi:M90 family metallopeptidase [Neolewinella persica]|uniref:M90 family metallopeptidase n=1 Tax=Neolewinella persica TaxID=70998 RepID=UPI000374EDCE|nr:M90 family metallopeptidase [Neolewinella persica]